MGSLQDESGPITKFPASDLRSSQRFITSHNAAGDGVFVASDSGDHHRIMVNGKGVANIIYSTQGNPVDVTDDNDIALAAKNEVRMFRGCFFFCFLHPTVFFLALQELTFDFRSLPALARFTHPQRQRGPFD